MNRVESFIDSKSITGRQGLLITPQISVEIAAAAVQVTFGLDTWDYSHFSQILVYPSEYKNPQTGKMHKGETNLGGFMCFSWKDFVAGNQSEDDKINLGLHEFGHALRFNGINGDDTDYFFEHYFKRWLACAAREFSRMRKGHSSILRKYGSVNINEFFSVVIETFFEKPLEFKTKLPELYNHTSIILNQTFLDDGSIELNCREKLMQKNKSVFNTVVNDALSYSLKDSGHVIAAVLFFVIGLISLSGEGYKYPPAYILFTIAGMFWMYFEKKFTRFEFIKNGFTVSKGFLLLKGVQAKTLPLPNMISFYANCVKEYNESGTFEKEMAYISIMYYDQGDFYEEEMTCLISRPQFDTLCDELIDNYIHVFIKK